MQASDWLPAPWRKSIKATVKTAKASFAQRFRGYGPQQLLDALRLLGVQTADTVMLHSSFSETSGFRGSIDDLIDTFEAAVGPDGHVLMVSLPYRDSTAAYLQRVKRFDVRNTPSMMGMVSEKFRRRAGVLRSAHATHPVLASGPNAAWFVEGHERCVHGCGLETPFARLVAVGGKACFFNAPFANLTYFHHLEHLVAPHLGLSLYEPHAVEVPVIDANGRAIVVRAHAFANDTAALRRFDWFEMSLRECSLIRSQRVRGSTLECADLQQVTRRVMDLAAHGRSFYDLSRRTQRS